MSQNSADSRAFRGPGQLTAFARVVRTQGRNRGFWRSERLETSQLDTEKPHTYGDFAICKRVHAYATPTAVLDVALPRAHVSRAKLPVLERPTSQPSSTS